MSGPLTCASVWIVVLEVVVTLLALVAPSSGDVGFAEALSHVTPVSFAVTVVGHASKMAVTGWKYSRCKGAKEGRKEGKEEVEEEHRVGRETYQMKEQIRFSRVDAKIFSFV